MDEKKKRNWEMEAYVQNKGVASAIDGSQIGKKEVDGEMRQLLVDDQALEEGNYGSEARTHGDEAQGKNTTGCSSNQDAGFLNS
jgi:hypothetical protein